MEQEVKDWDTEAKTFQTTAREVKEKNSEEQICGLMDC